MSKSVYLSPSTQEHNIGYGNYGTEEQRMNEVADVTQKILVEHGITVYRNRPEWTLQKVVEDSNSKKPTIHFAIHSNAYNEKTRGCEIFAYSPGGEGEKLARIVYAELMKISPTAGRGIKFASQLYELRKTNAPASLIEVAFHDNPDDAKWILENIEAIGIAIAKGILNYFGVQYQEYKEDMELKEAVDLLAKEGLINTPNYWVDYAVVGKQVNGEYAGILIKRIAKRLRGEKEYAKSV